MRICHYGFFVVAALAVGSANAQGSRVPLTGTVVDEQGQPVVDAVVEVFRADGRGFKCLDLDPGITRSIRSCDQMPHTTILSRRLEPVANSARAPGRLSLRTPPSSRPDSSCC